MRDVKNQNTRRGILGVAIVGGTTLSAMEGSASASGSDPSMASDRSLHGQFAADSGARLVGFRANARDAVVRDVASKMGEAISIMDFGAVGGDKAKDSLGMTRAIAHALSGSRKVLIPESQNPFVFGRINFPVNEIGVDGDLARPTKLTIVGDGTVHCTEDGFMFDCSEGYFYDLVISSGLRFTSIPGAGSKFINGGRFIRLLMNPGLQINNFDWGIYGETYVQTLRATGVIFRGGRGAFLKAPAAYDSRLTQNIIEFGQDGIVIDGVEGDPAVHTCTISDNVIESMSGRAIVLGSCMATQVVGNYLEANLGGDILLDAGTSPHRGLAVQYNSIQQHAERLNAEAYSVVWGSSTSLPVRAGGNYSTGHLHDMAGVTALIDTTGDMVPSGKNLRTPQTGRWIDTYGAGTGMEIGWFKREVRIDPYRCEIGFNRAQAMDDDYPVMTFASHSPQRAPGNFERTFWARGSMVFNLTPSEQSPMGWQCIQAGSPGSWRAVPGLT